MIIIIILSLFFQFEDDLMDHHQNNAGMLSYLQYAYCTAIIITWLSLHWDWVLTLMNLSNVAVAVVVRKMYPITCMSISIDRIIKATITG